MSTNNIKGKPGSKSIAAKCAAATAPDDFKIEEEKPYAELWMGTHPKLPSKDVETGRSLLELVQDNKALLGHEVADKYDNKLPFLFKVLSIHKALSIQAHPNKKLAEQLHAKDPKNYPDDNHKPEMTIAITPFEGLCGFRPLAEIAHFLKTVKPLRELVGEDEARVFEGTVRNRETSSSEEDVSSNKKALSSLFTTIMHNATATSTLEKATEQLLESASSIEDPSPAAADFAELIPRLNSQFPNDIGLFVLFFLNYVRLQPGEAMFLRADDIHAYISGDIIECMASSDNVVRAGFTPKFKDTATLSTMLTYDYSPIEEQKMDPEDYQHCKMNAAAYSSGSEALLYDPPIEEFAVVRTVLKSAGSKITFEAVPGPSIIICTNGHGKISVGPKVEEMKEGYVFFVGATAEVVLESEVDGEFVTFKAFTELQEKGEGKL
jgi:mannose-6-phosphate isomerase